MSPPPVQPKPPVAVGASIGIHVAFSGHIGDLLGVARRCAESGRKIPFVVVCSDPGLAAALRPFVEVLVYRWVASDGDPSPFDAQGNGDGAGWVDELMRRHSQALSADFHQFYNEVSFHGNAQSLEYARNVARVEIDMMRRADARYGVKLAMGNYMPGVPDPARYGEVLSPVWHYAQDHGHAALMHWYSDPADDSSMKNGAQYMVKRLLNYWGQWPRLPVLIGERGKYNSPRFRGRDALLQEWRDCAEVYRPYRREGRLILDAGWTIRGQDDIRWRLDDWTSHLDLYETELKAGRL